MKTLLSLSVVTLAALALAGCGGANASSNPSTKPGEAAKGAVKLLNVSYDPTRELYVEFNKSFAEHWKAEHNQEVTIEQSHGGSGKQARAVIDGLKADVVTLALAGDIDIIADKGLLKTDWQKEFEHNSSPYTSTIVFLVRKGNPKQLKDWNDLTKPGVEIITPNPKTSGGARWNYLAAWGYALKQELGDLSKAKDADAKDLAAANAKAKDLLKRIFANVISLETGARAATNKFTKDGLGDVLIAWENEAFLTVNSDGGNDFEIVVPSISILAEPPVAVVEKVATKNGTTEVAKAYLQHLYSPQGQALAARHYYRPAVEGAVPAEDLKHFVQLELFTIDDVFGGWSKAQKEHFDNQGTFDQIYEVK
jgi:sulfate/thiosulfate transport system substrate-binding protein